MRTIAGPLCWFVLRAAQSAGILLDVALQQFHFSTVFALGMFPGPTVASICEQTRARMTTLGIPCMVAMFQGGSEVHNQAATVTFFLAQQSIHLPQGDCAIFSALVFSQMWLQAHPL